MGARVLLRGVALIGLGGCGPQAGPAQDSGIDLDELTSAGRMTAGDGTGTATMPLPGTDDGGDQGGGGVQKFCPRIVEQRFPAIDIVFVIDNSTSMELEHGFLPLSLTTFGPALAANGIDAHVVLISAYPSNGLGLCISPPLGAGGCPFTDDNPPTYLHVDMPVDDYEQLDVIVATYPQWSSMVRREAELHLVIVSDDSPGGSWSVFRQQFEPLEPDKTAGYVFDAVAPSVRSFFCSTQTLDCCDVLEVFDIYHPEVYGDHVRAMDGVFGDLCQLADGFQTVTDRLVKPIDPQEPVPCSWDVSFFDPPIDPADTRVQLVGSTVEEVTFIGEESECDPSGWFVDDVASPKAIGLCPDTCLQVQGSVRNVEIQFGCLD